MKITDCVTLLEVEGQQGKWYPVLLHGQNNLALVDTGFPMTSDALFKAIRENGFEPEKINAIILTHQDLDHIGCVKELLALNPEIKVMTHKEEAPYIDGRKTPIKLAAIGKSDSFYETFKAGFDNRRISIDRELLDNEVLEICGKVEVIHTPGHTPGHICLYIKQDKVLIAGDTMNILNNALTGADPKHTFDMEMANKSVTKLLQYNIKTVLTYHGGKYKGSIYDVEL